MVWAFFHPITTYIACGRRSAIFWSILSALQLALIFGVDRAGIEFSTDLSSDAAESVRLGSYLGVILANTLVIGGNEVIRRASEEAREGRIS